MLRFFRPDPKKKTGRCLPMDVIGKLLQSGGLQLAIQAMMAEGQVHSEENSRKVSVTFVSGVMKNGYAKGWEWVKGRRKLGNGKTSVHYWMECDGWAIDPTEVPGQAMKVEKHSILVMDANNYRKALKLKVLTRKNPKQISQWLLKHKDKNMNDGVAMNSYSNYSRIAQPARQPEAVKEEVVAVPETVAETPVAEEPVEETVTAPLPEVNTPCEAVKDVQEPAVRPDASDVPDPSDKDGYRDYLIRRIVSMREAGDSNTKIATAFIREALPTRSGRGTWNPRMVNDIFKLAA